MSSFFEVNLLKNKQKTQQNEPFSINNNSNSMTKLPTWRTERYANNSLITVVANAGDSSQFSRQIATLKNVQVKSIFYLYGNIFLPLYIIKFEY